MLHTPNGMVISQRKFFLDLFKEYDWLWYGACLSPLDRNVKLRAKEGAILYDNTYYRKLAGKLNFLTNTKLDIAYSVQHLSHFMQDLREPHLKVAFYLLRYLKSDPILGLFLSRDVDYTIKGYCDSDWAACPDSRRFVSGYLGGVGQQSHQLKIQETRDNLFILYWSRVSISKKACLLTGMVKQIALGIDYPFSYTYSYFLWQPVISPHIPKSSFSWTH